MSHVEIDGGVVGKATLTDANGTRPLLEHAGAWRFFVAVVEDDGTRDTVWSGDSYSEATLEAGRLSRDHGPVYDRVASTSTQ